MVFWEQPWNCSGLMGVILSLVYPIIGQEDEQWENIFTRVGRTQELFISEEIKTMEEDREYVLENSKG